MSDTLNVTKPLQKPKTPSEIKDDITVMEAKNDYKRTNAFKWFILGISIVVITFLVIFAIFKIATSQTIQKYLLDQIINNIVFIGLAALAILKIELPNINK